MKTIGIVADNYKLERFKEKLTEKGFADFTIVAFTKSTSTIKVKIKEEDLKELSKVVQLVQLHFQRSN